jgi:hypothetical protein
MSRADLRNAAANCWAADELLVDPDSADDDV